jgi:phosphoglycerate dehydrogenase-like enzyme
MRCVIGPAAPDFMVDAVRAGGGTVVDGDASPDAAVWLSPRDPDGLRQLLDAAPTVRWVQLPFAGIEAFLDAGVLTPDRTWTCAKGVYAEPTAEHAMALTLAGLRRLPEHARASSWGSQGGRTLYDADVVILGGGGITTALLGLLAPYRCNITVVRRDASTPLAGATRTVGLDALDDVLPGALVVILALALTPQTEQVIGARQLERMDAEAWLVNVARGRHVDTDALVTALQAKAIGGAALDVTDPEPLPDDSPLWQLGNRLITPHTANPWSTAQPLLSRRIADNVRRYIDGEPLLGLVDLDAGY